MLNKLIKTDNYIINIIDNDGIIYDQNKNTHILNETGVKIFKCINGGSFTDLINDIKKECDIQFDNQNDENQFETTISNYVNELISCGLVKSLGDNYE